MIIPIPWSGLAISIITFPGVIVHEFAHKLLCQATNTRIRRVCYFRFGNPVGFVEHDVPTNIWKHILIACGPLFVNTTLGFLIGRLTLLVNTYSNFGMGLFVFISWLAVSVAMHAFPSIGDALGIWNELWKKPAPVISRMAGTPIAILIGIGAMGSVIWLDLFYGLCVVFMFPKFFY
ncbi:MAG: metalloprotease family protein [Opitutaceae bacterium]|jgi:hypothetical protein|nr:metalloprotease family protein [Opitutaceae bacterium]